ncbi:MAG TPA: glutathione S-transferase family protein [Beijerinckiaceae bacterium]|nr:glutathione S-transferase family protein [Beijerinckiaceae bacterium]
MLVLRSSPSSPFVRKIRIAAQVLGLWDRIREEPADTMNPQDSLVGQNPLGKIPALVLENGEVLYDSRVIGQYLDDLAGGGRIVPKGWGRYDVLRREALADGIMDASVLRVYEIRFRPEERREPSWVERQAQKVERGLEEAERTLKAVSGPVDLGQIALACVLGYLDFRFEGRWRASHPQLVAWLADFEKAVPAFDGTRPPQA